MKYERDAGDLSPTRDLTPQEAARLEGRRRELERQREQMSHSTQTVTREKREEEMGKNNKGEGLTLAELRKKGYSVPFRRLRSAAEMAAARGTDEDHHDGDQMICCALCGGSTLVGRKHAPAWNMAPDSRRELREAAVVAVPMTEEDEDRVKIEAVARQAFEAAREAFAAMDVKMHNAAGRVAFDKFGAMVRVARDENFMVEGEPLMVEARRQMDEAEDVLRLARGALAKTDRRLRAEREAWIEAEEKRRTEELQAPAKGEEEERRKATGARLRALLAK